LVEVDGGFSDSVYKVVPHILFQTLAHEDSLGDVHGIKIFSDEVRSRANGV
jgi:hypothetical protein